MRSKNASGDFPLVSNDVKKKDVIFISILIGLYVVYEYRYNSVNNILNK